MRNTEKEFFAFAYIADGKYMSIHLVSSDFLHSPKMLISNALCIIRALRHVKQNELSAACLHLPTGQRVRTF